MPKAITESTTIRRKPKRRVARKQALRVIARAEFRLRSIASDWQSGIPGATRFDLLQTANALLAVTLREQQHGAEA